MNNLLNFFCKCLSWEARIRIDVPVFLTAAIIIVLLNARQYFIGYGGYGFVKGVDPPGLTLGLPFTYYYYSFLAWEGEVIYLGIMGNLLFAGGVGAIAGVLAALLRRERQDRPA